MSEITFEYLNDEKTEWFVEYGAKRRARYRIPLKYEVTDEQGGILSEAYSFAYERIKVDTFRQMERKKRLSLIESLSRTFCTAYQPQRNYEIPKSMIRYAILQALEDMLEEYREEPN